MKKDRQVSLKPGSLEKSILLIRIVAGLPPRRVHFFLRPGRPAKGNTAHKKSGPKSGRSGSYL
ncbi:MAG: hypothetical protein D6714_09580 [Bacteroidetes bacterium]|nr:MAG: hypothetical protein D6714_09580 [Bacteroidota bacterium]